MLYLFRYRKIIILVTSLLLFSTIALYTNLIFQNNFENYDNLKPFRYRTIPNIVHYILFDQYEINFVTYLSILSSIKNQKPEFLFMHTNLEKLNGRYWNKILNLNTTKTVIEIKYLARPSHVYGQELSSVFHASDVARIIVLQRWGGIYLDYDVLILKNLESFMYYEMVVGWPEKEYMGTQVKTRTILPFFTIHLNIFSYYWGIKTQDFYQPGFEDINGTTQQVGTTTLGSFQRNKF